ncbi:MAG: hypothetical protein K6G37_01750, partial [Bacilli bacterium]|nr:hypothetical protein [Bacilli bacterium]
MDQYNTEEKALKLFKEQGLNAKENCIVALYKDLRKYSGFVAGMEYPYFGLLLNFTEEGVGLFYLVNPKILFKVNFEQAELKKDTYKFYKYEDIENDEKNEKQLMGRDAPYVWNDDDDCLVQQV